MRRRGGRRPDRMCWQVALVDACSFGALGLRTACRTLPEAMSVWAFATLDEACRTWCDVPAVCPLPDCLVVRLPTLPLPALTHLLALGRVAPRLPATVRLVVLTAVSADVVCRLLGVLGVAQPVRVINDRVPVPALCDALRPHQPPGCVPVLTAAVRMSPAECDVLWRTVRGGAVHTLARVSGVAEKTLYNRRTTALHKLGVTQWQRLLDVLRGGEGIVPETAD